MKKFPHAEFKVNWRPFELNPSAPKEGTNKVSIRLHGERVSKKEVGCHRPSTSTLDMTCEVVSIRPSSSPGPLIARPTDAGGAPSSPATSAFHRLPAKGARGDRRSSASRQ